MRPPAKRDAHPSSEWVSSVTRLLITGAILCCIIQLAWFGSKCFNQIDFDGMAYAGIARHIHEGEFHSAINAFRSPLISWLIAALSIASTDYLHLGKFVSVASFLLCLALLHAFALRLWRSPVVAAVAALLFVLGRGLCVEAVALITPDFLFAALVLVYFTILRRCVRTDSLKDWSFLGGIHGLAFLAKAFALPWLGCCTAVALLLSNKPWRGRVVRLGVAALAPLVVAGAWAGVLDSKYGVYTAGSQFKTNFLQWTLRAFPEHREKTYGLLRDTSKELDEYVVDDPMPPGSWAWTYHVSMGQAVPKLLLAEKNNVPKVVKELAIVVTPGVLLAFIFSLQILTRKRHLYAVEWRLAAVIVSGAIGLVLAYSMLAFDERYLFPLIPLILAVGSRFLVPDPEFDHAGWRRLSVSLVVLGVCVSLLYRSSPFRVLARDFQVVGYEAGAILKEHEAPQSLVGIGSGPFPEHGVGWEASYQATYFGGGRLIATLDSLPSSTELATLQSDLRKARPDAVIVWGRPSHGSYKAVVQGLALQYPRNAIEAIRDPMLGEVGTVVFTNQRLH